MPESLADHRFASGRNPHISPAHDRARQAIHLPGLPPPYREMATNVPDTLSEPSSTDQLPLAFPPLNGLPLNEPL